MFDHPVIKPILLLAVLILAATNVAQAKIIQAGPASRSATVVPLGVPDYLNTIPFGPALSTLQQTKTITLNFGPLHFQEVLKHSPKACPS